MWIMCLLIAIVVAIVFYNKGWHEGNKHGYFIGYRCGEQECKRKMEMEEVRK